MADGDIVYLRNQKISKRTNFTWNHVITFLLSYDLSLKKGENVYFNSHQSSGARRKFS